MQLPVLYRLSLRPVLEVNKAILRLSRPGFRRCLQDAKQFRLLRWFVAIEGGWRAKSLLPQQGAPSKRQSPMRKTARQGHFQGLIAAESRGKW